MTNFTKQDLESIYNTRFSDMDIEIINQRMIHETQEALEEDTRYFDNLQAYVDYVYLDDLSNARILINDIVRCIKEDLDISLMNLILSDSDDIVLPNNRCILVLD